MIPSTYTIERKHSWGLDLSGTMQGAGGVEAFKINSGNSL
jgi:hypothetical protein